jgi:hypothetical protein
MVFETRRNCLAAMSIALHEFNHLCFFLMNPPFLECSEVWKYKSVSIITIATTVR